MRGVVLALALALGGCASGYNHVGFFGGFEETPLAPNVYRVAYAGNGYTTGARAENMALLRSADLTLQKGFRYFALADAQSYTSTDAFTTPTQSTTNFNAVRTGNVVTGGAYTTTTGGQLVFIHRPRANNIVVMFPARPDGEFVFDAAFICENIGKQYGVQCGRK